MQFSGIITERDNFPHLCNVEDFLNDSRREFFQRVKLTPLWKNLRILEIEKDESTTDVICTLFEDNFIVKRIVCKIDGNSISCFLGGDHELQRFGRFRGLSYEAKGQAGHEGGSAGSEKTYNDYWNMLFEFDIQMPEMGL
uniref:Uncharacterized protein n=1 Tax=Glossina pallidipes TaxID=7398 RepID=A0A1A9ZXS3_GLOPL